MVDLSANEAASLTKLAARGAGYPWGLCEEAVVAARWLCSFELSGMQALLSLCLRVDQQPLSTFTPQIEGTTWKPVSAGLCPLICGSALSDRAALIAARSSITIESVMSPILLLPFVAQMSAISATSVQLSWNDFVLVCHADQIYANRDADDFDQRCMNDDESATVALQMHIEPSSSMSEWSVRTDSRQNLLPACLHKLQKLAQRTYAPNTEQSRLLGAGAGNSDND